MAIGRTNTGGGGTGATLVVTGVAGDTCTISKDGKTKSKTFDADGKATFKGLATGTWTVTMTSSSGQSATQTIVINADYTLTISYFSASIAVTYPAGSTCTATDGSTTLNAPDTTGTWVCVVPNAGTWTVSCTDGTQTASNTVTLTTLGQSASVKLEYSLVVYSSTTGQHLPFVVTRGPTGSASTSLTFPDGSLSFYTNNAAVFTEESYDLAHYSTLTFEYEDNSAVAAQTFVCGVALANTNSSSAAYIAKVVKSPTSATSRTVVTLDISALDKTKKYYIGFTKYNGDGVMKTVKVYDWRCV